MALMLVFSACKAQKQAQQKPSKSKKHAPELPADLAVKYREDANRLALRELQAQKTVTGEMEARIPADRVEYYYDKLSKAWALWMMNDSIEDLDYIHTFPNPDMRTVRIIITPESPYLKTWSQKNEITDNLYINQLISRYGLQITDYKSATLGPTFLFQSEGFINTPELCFILSNFEGIKFAEPEGMAGDGNDIEVTATAKTGRILRFSVGAGDCPSGCMYRKYWNFLLQDDGSVVFIGIEGSLTGPEEK